MSTHNIDSNLLPFRQGVGMVIFNKNKHIFVAKRLESKFEAWQMPQGGILVGETPSKAVLREMREEIGCNKANIIAETKKWYSYHIPHFLINKLWEGQYKGQKQKWFLVEFIGEDQEINIHTDTPEFCEWKWVPIPEMLDIVVPFKKPLYLAVLKEFEHLI